MQVQENFSLKRYNTFGIDAKAHRFAAFHSADELAQFLELTGGVPFMTLMVIYIAWRSFPQMNADHGADAQISFQ